MMQIMCVKTPFILKQCCSKIFYGHCHTIYGTVVEIFKVLDGLFLDLMGVAKFIDECLEIVYSAGPLNGGQASDQP